MVGEPIHEYTVAPPSSGVPYGVGRTLTVGALEFIHETKGYTYERDEKTIRNGEIENKMKKFFPFHLSKHAGLVNIGEREKKANAPLSRFARRFAIIALDDDATIHDLIQVFGAYQMGINKMTLSHDAKGLRQISTNITEHMQTSRHDETLQERRPGFLRRR